MRDLLHTSGWVAPLADEHARRLRGVRPTAGRLSSRDFPAIRERVRVALASLRARGETAAASELERRLAAFQRADAIHNHAQYAETIARVLRSLDFAMAQMERMSASCSLRRASPAPDSAPVPAPAPAPPRPHPRDKRMEHAEIARACLQASVPLPTDEFVHGHGAGHRETARRRASAHAWVCAALARARDSR